MGYRLPLVTTISTFLLMVLGELVVGKDAGFVCKDWPLCNGQLIPSLNGLILLELSHRAVTVAVSILVVLTVIAALIYWRHSRDSIVLGLALAAFLLLIAQAAMGALIVVFVLPGAATTIDVLISFLLLATLCALTTVVYRNQREKQTESNDLTGTRAIWLPVAVTTIVTLFQVVVGGFFRHSGESEALFGQHAYLLSHDQHTMPATASSMAMLLFHIALGMIVLGCTIWLLLAAVRRKTFVRSSVALFVLTVAQMLLGFISYGTELALWPVTLHWSDSGLMWAILASVSTQCWLAFQHSHSILKEKGVIA